MASAVLSSLIRLSRHSSPGFIFRRRSPDLRDTPTCSGSIARRRGRPIESARTKKQGKGARGTARVSFGRARFAAESERDAAIRVTEARRARADFAQPDHARCDVFSYGATSTFLATQTIAGGSLGVLGSFVARFPRRFPWLRVTVSANGELAAEECWGPTD